MPITSILILAIIIFAFVLFAVVLAWGERQTRHIGDANRRAAAASTHINSLKQGAARADYSPGQRGSSSTAKV